MQIIVTLADINVNGLNDRTVQLDYPLLTYLPLNDGDIGSVSWSRAKHEAGSIVSDFTTTPNRDIPDDDQYLG